MKREADWGARAIGWLAIVLINPAGLPRWWQYGVLAGCCAMEVVGWFASKPEHVRSPEAK